MITNLKTLLQTWEDFDVTKYYIACVIGLMRYESDFSEFRKYKYIFWTNNPLGHSLDRILEELVNANILEFDPDEIAYRWNPDNRLP